MFAGGECVECDGVVEVMGQEDFDQVEIGQGKKLVMMAENSCGGYAPLDGAAFGSFGVSIADGDDQGALVLQVFEGVQVADAAGSDESYA